MRAKSAKNIVATVLAHTLANFGTVRAYCLQWPFPKLFSAKSSFDLQVTIGPTKPKRNASNCLCISANITPRISAKFLLEQWDGTTVVRYCNTKNLSDVSYTVKNMHSNRPIHNIYPVKNRYLESKGIVRHCEYIAH